MKTEEKLIVARESLAKFLEEAKTLWEICCKHEGLTLEEAMSLKSIVFSADNQAAYEYLKFVPTIQRMANKVGLLDFQLRKEQQQNAQSKSHRS